MENRVTPCFIVKFAALELAAIGLAKLIGDIPTWMIFGASAVLLVALWIWDNGPRLPSGISWQLSSPLADVPMVRSKKFGFLVRLKDAADAAYTQTRFADRGPVQMHDEQGRRQLHLEKLLREAREGQHGVFGRVPPSADWTAIDESTFLTTGNLTRDLVSIGTRDGGVIHWGDVAIKKRDLARHIRRLGKSARQYDEWRKGGRKFSEAVG